MGVRAVKVTTQTPQDRQRFGNAMRALLDFSPNGADGKPVDGSDGWGSTPMEATARATFRALVSPAARDEADLSKDIEDAFRERIVHVAPVPETIARTRGGEVTASQWIVESFTPSSN